MQPNLKPFVNNSGLYEDFLEVLDQKLESVHKAMEQATSPEELYRLQGDARTLRRLKTLREEVNGK